MSRVDPLCHTTTAECVDIFELGEFVREYLGQARQELGANAEEAILCFENLNEAKEETDKFLAAVKEGSFGEGLASLQHAAMHSIRPCA